MRNDIGHNLDRLSGVTTDLTSYTSILRSRESPPSDIMSLFRVFTVTPEQEEWYQRAKLIFRTVSLCLGPGNLWRLPQQSLTYGKATYIYLYILYSWICGVPLLVFELSMGQHFGKGFANVFSPVPLVQGITLSMTGYCIVANLLFSLLSVYSLIFTISGLYETMPHSACFNKHECSRNDYGNYTNSPEYIYLHNYIIQVGVERFNIRNGTILIGIWIVLCTVIVFGVFKYHLLTVILSVGTFITLMCTAIVSLVLDSSHLGLKTMFVPTTEQIHHLTTWIYPAEQSVVSLGIGAGPLTTLWSISKIKYWSHLDCVLANLVAFVCGLLSASVLFNATGVMTTTRNQSIENYISANDVEVYLLSTQLFNTMGSGASNLMVCLYYLMMFSSCCCAMLEYTQILLLYIGSYVNVKKIGREKIIMLVCTLMYVSAAMVFCKVGYTLAIAINDNFIGTALLIMVTFELISVFYCYGLHDFCDDIEFTLGTKPNYFYQTSWMLLPIVFLLFSIASLYLKFTSVVTRYDSAMLYLALAVTLVPVILIGAYKYFNQELGTDP